MKEERVMAGPSSAGARRCEYQETPIERRRMRTRTLIYCTLIGGVAVGVPVLVYAVGYPLLAFALGIGILAPTAFALIEEQLTYGW
jgi:hypothetical protein